MTATLHQRLAAVAASTPDAPAMHLGDATWTFADLRSRVAATAGAVASLTAPGDRVAVVAWNGSWWIEAAFGVPMAGRTLAMISPRSTVAEITVQLDTVQPALVVVDPAVTTRLDPFAAPGRTVIDLPAWVAMTTAAAPRVDGAAEDPAAVAWLVFTSGTTAAPKAAMLTHRGLLAAVEATAASRPSIADDVYLFPFPLWHVALYNVVCRLVAGRPVVLHGRFEPAEIVAAVARHRVTSMSLAATMLDALLDEVERDPSAIGALASLTDITYGAAPMPLSVLRRAAARLDVRFWQGYGMTELSGNAVFLSAGDHRRGLAGEADLLRAAGRAAPGVEMRIADDHDAPLPTGARGEIHVRAAQVMAGYWGDAEATAAAVTPDGWLRTGDIGTLDATGLLHVLDRKKDVIITGGENVSAREVEEVLRQHPAVADVAVVGVPDARWGEDVCAVVVSRGALDADELRAFARERLAGFKVPRRLAARDALPVNASGKVVKAELRAWLAANPEVLDARR